ncbi:putative dna primase small subunit [Phaeomoniella chlamydospora]|uniref:DNA primase n=1 Tax=Phaeomoniella chlamydospora TaxID=158046 RepID=A0A0G2GD91_PHACM|nr:putative dna primase small subunit [Phaeomoniella chlamydospora]
MAPASSQSSSPDADDISLPDAPSTKDETSQSDVNSSAENPVPKADVKLEDLFEEEDDDDDEYSSSVPQPSSPPRSSQVEPITSITAGARYSDPEVMYAFYQRLFPFRQLYQWLNHGIKPSTDFAHREFAFTLQNDAYLRYQSFPSADLLRKDILRLNPSRFEIGPVYTSNPRERKTLRKSTAFKPLAKEIVFDIDLTDYDDIRTCCDKANICNKCWTFVTMAIKVVDTALRDDFGFEHIMWVYSGRRGAHAWISDKSARELDDDKRKAIAGYFEVLKGGAQGGKRVNLKRPLHPHLTRSLDILKSYFQTSILVDQEPFLSTAGAERLLSLLPDAALVTALRKKWSSSPDRASAKKWADIDALASTGVSKNLDTTALMQTKQDILLEYTYPRLDVEVSKKRIHLLKSPFVVHPGTGRVCVPITSNASEETRKVENFNPLTVPTVTDLLSEVDNWGKTNDENSSQDPNEFTRDGNQTSSMRKLQDWEKTALKPYVETFDRFVKNIMKDEIRLKRERDDDRGTGPEGMEF